MAAPLAAASSFDDDDERTLPLAELTVMESPALVASLSMFCFNLVSVSTAGAIADVCLISHPTVKFLSDLSVIRRRAIASVIVSSSLSMFAGPSSSLSLS